METQTVFRITENRKLIKPKYPVEGEAVIDHSNAVGWLRFKEYIGRVEGLRRLFGLLPDNSRIMVVDERDGLPISPYRPAKSVMEKQCTMIGDGEMADRQGDFQLSKQRAEERKHWYYNSMALAIMGIVFCFVVVVLLYVSGKFGA